MELTWQNGATIALIVAALGYVSWRLWRMTQGDRSAGCHACGSCPTDEKRDTLITIDGTERKD